MAFHLFILLILGFTVLRTVVPDEDGGILVNFGNVNAAAGTFEPKYTGQEPPEETTTPPPPVPQPKVETPKEELITQDMEESVAIEEAKKKKEKEELRKKEEEKKRKEEAEKERIRKEEAEKKAAAPAEESTVDFTHEEEIDFDTFCKVELRVAEVRACENLKESKKLLHLTVFDGERERCILSGIAKWFKPEDLIGKKIGIVCNLAPRPMMKGKYVSEGMIFAADTADGGCSIAFYGDDTPVGSRIH